MSENAMESDFREFLGETRPNQRFGRSESPKIIGVKPIDWPTFAEPRGRKKVIG
jgi:hypothetical protein